MKALVGAADDRTLSFAMIGPEASEVMAAVQMAAVTDHRPDILGRRCAQGLLRAPTAGGNSLSLPLRLREGDSWIDL